MGNAKKRDFPEILAKVLCGAYEYAEAFVEEFDAPLDPASASDWDATAWDSLLARIRRDHEVDDELASDLWPIFRNLLVYSSERLAETPPERRADQRPRFLAALRRDLLADSRN
jgi:hypothetical protein